MASKGQQAIFDTLMDKPMTIMQLMEVTYLSDSFVRNTVKFLEQTGQVEKVDDRVPFMYRVSEKSNAAKESKLCKGYKLALINSESTDSLDRWFISSVPKNFWNTMPVNLRAMAKAIEELESEGKLIETL
jgi:hypothetical protein